MLSFSGFGLGKKKRTASESVDKWSLLYLTVLEGRNTLPRGNEQAPYPRDIYYNAQYRRQQFKSTHVKAAQDPKWSDAFMIALNNERMVRHAPESRKPKKEGEVKKEVVVTVWDYNIIDEDDFLGCVTLSLSSLQSKAEEANPTIEWFPLKSGCIQCLQIEFQKKRRRSRGGQSSLGSSGSDHGEHVCSSPEGIQGELLVKAEFVPTSSNLSSSNCISIESYDQGNPELKECTDPRRNHKRRNAILNKPLPPASSLPPPVPLSRSNSRNNILNSGSLPRDLKPKDEATFDTDNYVLESGNNYVLESGNNYVLESDNNYVLESGNNYVLESGNNYVLESGNNYVLENGDNYVLENESGGGYLDDSSVDPTAFSDGTGYTFDDSSPPPPSSSSPPPSSSPSSSSAPSPSSAPSSFSALPSSSSSPSPSSSSLSSSSSFPSPSPSSSSSSSSSSSFPSSTLSSSFSFPPPSPSSFSNRSPALTPTPSRPLPDFSLLEPSNSEDNGCESDLHSSQSDFHLPEAYGSATDDYLEGGEEIFQNQSNLQFGTHFGDDLLMGENHDDWNLRFQRTLDRVREIDVVQEIDEYRERIRVLNRHLINLSQDFYWNARNYAKIIISEHFLPKEKKTIKPADDFSEGAGGTKYVVHNIIFKFATAKRTGHPDRDLFEDGADAAKVTAHELKGLTCYNNCNVRGLCFPMMVIVDYRGFRVSAVSMLPISDGTLIYGSSDRGKTIHADDEIFNRKMAQTAKMIGLKEHLVGKTEETRKCLSAPFDVEGHRGTDGRYYLLDFSRTMPPEKKNRNFRGGILFQLLRPEFVIRYVKHRNMPLCPDTYSPPVPPQDRKQHEQEVEMASEYLYNKMIPKFAKYVVESMEQRSSTGEKVENYRLTEQLHRHGVNVRHLGRLILALHNLPSSPYQKNAITLMLCEVCARVIKNTLRKRLRETMRRFKVVLEEPCRRSAVDYLNLVFANTSESTDEWESHIKAEIQKNFVHSLDFLNENEEKLGLKAYVLSLKCHALHFIFKRVVQMSCLSFTQELMRAIEMSSNYFEQCNGRPIDETDLLALNERIKHMNIVSLAQGYLHMVKGREVRVENPNLAQRSFRAAIQKFEEALDSNTMGKIALRNLGSALLYLEKEIVRSKGGSLVSLTSPNIVRADQYIRRAIEIDPDDPHTCRMYARLLIACQLPRRAEHWYLRALELNPNNPRTLYEFSDLLRYTLKQQKHGFAFQNRFSEIQKSQTEKGEKEERG